MAIEQETGFLSLADLASLNTDEIKALTSRVPDEGIFTVRGTEVSATENKSDDSSKPPLFSFNFQAEVLEAKPLAKDKDPEDYVGRTLRERYTLWPSDFKEALGLLKGRYQTVGMSNEGPLGGVEGAEPGWLDGMVGTIFRIRIRHFTDKNKVVRAAYDWLPLEEEKAA